MYYDASGTRQAATNSLAATFGEPPSVRKMLGTAKLCLLCFLSARVPSQSRP
jgi:hypothetical protein